MSQKLPVNNFEWIKDNRQFNEDFMKSYNEDSAEVYFLEVDVQYQNQNVFLKWYIDVNADLRKKCKKRFCKRFF